MLRIKRKMKPVFVIAAIAVVGFGLMVQLAVPESWTLFLSGIEIPDAAVYGNELWCASHIDGLYCLDRRNGSVRYYIPADSLDTKIVSAVGIDPKGIVWVGTKDGVRSFDGCEWIDYPESRITERTQKTAHTIESDSDDYVTCVAVDSTGAVWFGYYGRVMMMSGDTWTMFRNELPDNFITDITVDSKGTVWAGSWMQGVNYYRDDTWTTVVDNLLLLLFQGVFSICEDRNGILWFAGIGGKAAMYDGTSFTEYPFIDTGLREWIKGCAVDRNNVVWFGASDGVSCYNGKEWRVISAADGSSLEAVNEIVVDEANVKWFATNNGLARLDESVTSVGSASDIPQGKFAVVVAPNPFNAVASISYTVSETGTVRLDIFDVVGRKVANLVDRKLTPGRYTVLWDARNCPSGLYFCCVHSVTSMTTIKLTLIK